MSGYLYSKKIRRDCYFGILTFDMILSHTSRTDRLLNTAHCVTYIDIKSAYDHAPLYKVWQYMERKGYNTSLLQAIFNNNKIYLMNAIEFIGQIELQRGVPQGVVASPVLFDILIASFIDSLNDKQYSRIDFYQYSLITYAGDIVFITRTIQQMKQLLLLFELFLKSCSMTVSTEKCGTFHSRTLKLFDQVIPLVKEYKYLGIHLNKYGVCQKSLLVHIKKQIDIHFNTSPRKGFKNYGYFLYNASLCFKTFLRSTVHYYMRLLNQSHFHKLCSILYDYIRQYFHTHRKISMDNSLKLLGCQSFTTRYHQARNKTFEKVGHSTTRHWK